MAKSAPNPAQLSKASRQADSLRAVPAYDARAEARRLLRIVASGALGTIDRRDGAPFTTLVTVAPDCDGSPILLTSALSAHSSNLSADPRASLLLALGGKGDPLAHPRLTLSGRCVKAALEERPRLRSRFLARHPKAALYADFGDFSFWRFEGSAAHFNGGFAKAAQFAWEDLCCPVEDAGALIACEGDAIAHLNADHADALKLYARVYAGEKTGRWRASTLDPEGLDLQWRECILRIPFADRVTTPESLRAALASLAKEARKRLE